MNKLAATVAFVLMGCTGEKVAYGVERLHDDSLHVTCWVFHRGGISCLPDRTLSQ